MLQQGGIMEKTDFDTVIKRITPVLKRITYRLKGSSCFLSSEDLFQEAMIHLLADFRAGKLADKTDSYILQGCYFYLKNYIRKAAPRRCLVSLEALSSDAESGICWEDMIADHNDNRKEYIDNLHDKLLVETIRNNGFSLIEKEMFGYYADGLTTREIGLKLGISHVMVIKRMAKVREKCRKYIDLI